ncbi:hypothetical protein [Polaromonas sp. UC242_47]|uniref:hypothetical protein n=1 Tax=Polaromonas sp. UC242_47 TaxID=3374626 RepID=UPI00378F2538
MLKSKIQSLSPQRALLMAGATAVLAVAAMGFSGGAHARSDVSFSVGVAVPGVQVGIGNAYPVYGAPVYGYPQPVYVQPQPVYVQPAPVYVRPRPVFVQQAPVYYGPPPMYYGYGGGYYRHGHRDHDHGHGDHGNGHRGDRR